MSDFYRDIFTKIGAWIHLNEKFQKSFVNEMIANLDEFTVGLTFTILAASFGLLILKIIFSIPNFFSQFIENRRIKFTEIDRELIHKKHEFVYLSQELKNLTQKIAELEENKLLSDEELQVARENNCELENSCQMLRQNVVLHQKQIDDLECTLEENTSKFEFFAAKINEKNDEIDKFSRQITTQESTISQLEAKLESLSKLEEITNNQKILIENIFEEFLIKNKFDTQDDVSFLKKFVNDLQSPTELQSNYLNNVKLLTERDITIIDLKTTITQFELNLSKSDEKYKSLQHQKNEVDHKLSLTNELLSSTMNKIYDERAENLLLTREREIKEREISEYKRKISADQTHLKSYDELINSVRLSRDGLEEKYRSVQLLAGKHEETISALKNEITSLQSKLSQEISINEANRPFARGNVSADFHPCFLSFLNNHQNLQNFAPKEDFETVTSKQNIDDLMNVAEYKFPTKQIDQMSIVSDLKSDFSRRESNFDAGNLLNPPIPLTSTFRQDPSVDFMRNTPSQFSIITTAGSDLSLSVTSEKFGVMENDFGKNDNRRQSEPKSEDLVGNIPSLDFELPNFPASSSYFVPEFHGECQFEDPFALSEIVNDTVENCEREKCPDERFAGDEGTNDL